MNNTKQQLYIASAVFATVILGVVLVVWVFLFGSLQEEAEQYIENSRTLSEVEQRASLSSALKREFQQVQEEAEIFDSALLPADDQTVALTMIEELDRITAEVGTTYQTQSIRPSAGNLSAFTFDISLNGDFQGILRTLQELRRASMLTSVQQLSMSGQGGETMTASLTLFVYTR